MEKRYSTQKTASFADGRMKSGYNLSGTYNQPSAMKQVAETPMLVDDGEDDCSSSSRSRSSSRKSFMQELEGEDEDPNDTSVARNGSYVSQK